jgi:hypothetical protein
MAQKYSTCLVNLLVGGRNLRSILDNCVLKIYTGAAPADADAQETGTVLCIVSLSGAWNGTAAAGTTGDAPSVDEWYFPIPINAGKPTAGKSFQVVLQLDGINGTYEYDCVASDATGATAQFVDRLANMINQAQRPVRAIGISGPADQIVAVSPVVRGLGMTLIDGGGTGDTIVPVHALTKTRPNTLQFGPPTLGVISKLAEAWTGTNLATGVAGYFRLVLPNDTGLQDAALTMPRVQGSVGTSGADMNLDSVQFVISATTTISAFSIQEPTSA